MTSLSKPAPPDPESTPPLKRAAGRVLARRLAWVLGALSICGPFSIDMYLSAFSRMAQELGTSLGMVQMTLAIFLLGLAAGQIFWGTLMGWPRNIVSPW